MPGPGDDILMVPTGKSIGRTYAIMSKTIAAGDEILIMHSRDGKTYGYKPSQIFAGDPLLLCPVKGDKRMVVGLTDYPDFISAATWTTWAESYASASGSGNSCSCTCAANYFGHFDAGATISIPIRAYCNRQMFSYTVAGSQWVGDHGEYLGCGNGHSTYLDLGGGFYGASGTWYGTQELQKGQTWTCSFWMTADTGALIIPGETVSMAITGIYLWRE